LGMSAKIPATKRILASGWTWRGGSLTRLLRWHITNRTKINSLRSGRKSSFEGGVSGEDRKRIPSGVQLNHFSNRTSPRIIISNIDVGYRREREKKRDIVGKTTQLQEDH